MRGIAKFLAIAKKVKEAFEGYQLFQIKFGNRKEWIGVHEYFERQKDYNLSGVLYGSMSKDRQVSILQVSTFPR